MLTSLSERRVPDSLENSGDHSQQFNKVSAGEHLVQFYGDDDHLVHSVSQYVSGGFILGEPAILITTPAHRAAIEQKLESTGFSLEFLRTSGQLVFLDAATTLTKFMRGGMPDEACFDEVVGALVRKFAARGNSVRAFGEMVAILWADGYKEAALELEQIWNRLQETHRFSLFCAYPIHTFGCSSQSEPFIHVCNAHSRVIPSESFSPSNADDGMRAIAILQQKAASLEAEIAERRRVEEELRAFVENASLGLHWVGPDGIIKWANRADFELLGYSREEYVGHHISEFHADQPVILDILGKLQHGERLEDYVARLKCKDGSLRHVLIDSCGLWKDGKFIHSQCFTRDITERKHAQESFQQLVSLMPAGVYVCDGEGRITLFNRRAVELWGYEPDLKENTQKFCACYKVLLADGTFVPPDETPMAYAIKEGKSFRGVEATVERPDGSQFIALVNIDPLRNPDGSIAGAINVFQDITARKAEQIASQRLAAIVESSDDAIFATDLDGTITSWNKGAERTYGYQAAEMVGKPIYNVIPPERVHEEDEIFERIRNNEHVEQYETVRRRKDGSYFDVSLTVSPVKDLQGKLVGASKIARDITERKAAERELKRAKDELEVRVKERTVSLEEAVAQMEEFSYSISHDLRGPLRAMQGYCQILLEDAASELSEDNLTYLKRISHSAERLDRLVQDVLSFTRVSRTEMPTEAVDLEQLFREVFESYFGEQGPQPEVFIRSPLAPVLAHEPSLLQCLSNLIGNALKFVRPGSLPKISIWTEQVDGYVRLWVEDNGIGIHPDHLEKIFGMFERAPEASNYPGTGVGLAIVKKAVNRMKGEVGLDSTLGQGSRFWIQLPSITA